MRRQRALSLVVPFLLVLLLASNGQAAVPRWELRLPWPQNEAIWSVAYGDGLFVAVGARGAIVTSPDGSHWRAQRSGTTADLSAVIFGGDRFIAGGKDGALLTSVDGFRWVAQASLSAPDGGSASIRAMAAGDGILVAVGDQGLVASSQDGITWFTHRTEDGADLYDVVYGDGRFTAVGRSEGLGGVVEVSADGVNWTGTFANQPEGLFAIARGGGSYVAVGAANIYASEGGTAWRPVRPATLRALTYGENLFVGLLASGGSVISADGVTWTPGGKTPPFAWSDVVYGDGRYVAVAYGGVTAYSTDGAAWTNSVRDEQALGDLHDVAFGDEHFVAVGEANRILTSGDGRRWREQRLPGPGWFAGRLNTVTYGHGRFVTAGYSILAASPDGEQWTAQNRPGNWLVRFVGDRFVAWDPHPNEPKALTSTDGVAWTETQALPCSVSDLVDLRYGHGISVALCRWGALYSSTDGTTWTKRMEERPGKMGFYGAITFGGGRFVALVGNSREGEAWGAALTSTDGVRWERREMAPLPARSLIYGGGIYIAPAWGEVAWSDDGLSWSREPGLPRALAGVAYGRNRFVVVGGLATVLTAAWPPIPSCAERFRDMTEERVAYAAVADLAARGLVAGMADGGFHPDQPLTRAEAAKLLILALEIPPARSMPQPFADTAGHWVETGGYLQAAVSSGAIRGFPDSTFRPDQPVTRAELVKMVAAAAGLAPAGTPDHPDLQPTEWYAGWVAVAAKAGLLGSGAPYPIWGEGPFLGDQPVTRAEAAIVLANLP